MQVVLTNTPAERQRLVAALQDFARTHHLSADVVHAADLALEEHLTNVFNYAYADAQPPAASVQFSLEERCLLVEVADEGKPFNPLAAPEPDTSLPLDKKPIGGLGVHLMRRFMDELQYQRVGNRNILRMRKRLASPAA